MTNDDGPDVLQLRAGRFNNTTISRDLFDDEEGPLATILYIPDMERGDHEHISFDLLTAAKMFGWLARFLDDHRPELQRRCSHQDEYGSLFATSASGDVNCRRCGWRAP